jgi:hypothetical protein
MGQDQVSPESLAGDNRASEMLCSSASNPKPRPPEDRGGRHVGSRKLIRERLAEIASGGAGGAR